MISSKPLSPSMIEELYGEGARSFTPLDEEMTFVFSQSREFDLFELEQLLAAVGWSRRPQRRVKKALENSLLSIGLWSHDPRIPRLVGFARCTGDGVLEATVWDVVVHPVYQGSGLGKELMKYVLEVLRKMRIQRVTLFADPEVVDFYLSQGWVLEPKGRRCAFWYAN